MTDELISNLTNLGFSKLEAEIYIALVQNGKMTGYAIAKKLNKTRPSVYNALDNLLEKNIINFVRGEKSSSEYVAVAPELLLTDISQKVTVSASKAKKSFKELQEKISVPHFQNIEGKSALISTANMIINSAKREIIINSSMPLDFFKDSLIAAAKRNVRIILFSWEGKEFLKLNSLGIPIEFYSGFDGTDYCAEERIFLVADLCRCVIGSNDTSAFIPHKKITKKLPTGEQDFLGLTSTNRLIVNMVTEHIHFDIYLNKLKRKTKRSLFTPDILLASLMEKGV